MARREQRPVRALPRPWQARRIASCSSSRGTTRSWRTLSSSTSAATPPSRSWSIGVLASGASRRRPSPRSGAGPIADHVLTWTRSSGSPRSRSW